MSVVGPRPALWNQDVLISERDKYHANNVKPGLTGLAQINGRDKLEIPDKAKLDGITAHEYAHILNSDCDLTEKSRNSTREQKEILADEQAYKMMKNILYTQYRCEQSDILVEIKRIYTNVISDQKIFGIAAKWSKDSLRNFENFQ